MTWQPNENSPARFDPRDVEAVQTRPIEDGALDVGGRRVELVHDERLAELLEPWAVRELLVFGAHRPM